MKLPGLEEIHTLMKDVPQAADRIEKRLDDIRDLLLILTGIQLEQLKQDGASAGIVHAFQDMLDETGLV